MNNDIYNLNKNIFDTYNILSTFSKNTSELLKSYCQRAEEINKSLQNSIAKKSFQ